MSLVSDPLSLSASTKSSDTWFGLAGHPASNGPFLFSHAQTQTLYSRGVAQALYQRLVPVSLRTYAELQIKMVRAADTHGLMNLVITLGAHHCQLLFFTMIEFQGR